MRKISVILAILIALSSVNVFADITADAENIWQADVLRQLGLISTYDMTSTVTKNDAKLSVDMIFGNETASGIYFENQDLNSPLLFGQAVMIFVDVMGYTPVINPEGYNPDAVDTYMNFARRMKLIKNETLSASSVVTADVYSVMLYRALAELPYMSFESILNGDVIYNTDKTTTVFTEVMDINVIEDVVTGAGDISLTNAQNPGAGIITIGGYKYKCSADINAVNYLGYTVSAYVNSEDNTVKALSATENENNILWLEAENISDTSLYSIGYYEGKKEKEAKLSPTVDVVYNGSVLRDYKAEDFLKPNAEYTLIDNNCDRAYDVVIIKNYDTFIVQKRIEAESILVDKAGNIYDFKDYITDGYKILNADGTQTEFAYVTKDMVVSVTKDASGKITGAVVSNQKISGTYESYRKNGTVNYITIDGNEYECSAQYSKKTGINLGDRVKAYFDINGRVFDMISITSITHAGHLLDYYDDWKGVYFKVLTDDGSIKTLTASGNVVVNGVKKSISSAMNTTVFMDGSNFRKQLILYRVSNDDKITWMDTAENKSSLGSTGYDDFTLNYSYESDGAASVTLFNSKRILASKYFIDGDAVVFGVSDKDDECYVQTGNSVVSSTDLKINLYNVNEDYEPEFVVIKEDNRVPAWVSGRYDSAMVDMVVKTLDKDGNDKYAVKYYTYDGNYRTSVITDENLIPINGNAFSGDARLNSVKLKDLPKGSIIQFKEDAKGIYAYVVQFIPRKENDEIIFEKISSEYGWDYGLDNKKYNGAELHSYGVVLRIVPAGIIINNHLPTDEEAAGGLTFPIEKWNRYITFASQQTVLFFDKETEEITIGTPNEILPGDMIYSKRSALVHNGVYIYR